MNLVYSISGSLVVNQKLKSHPRRMLIRHKNISSFEMCKCIFSKKLTGLEAIVNAILQ